jgi:adenylate kinase family enzyme
MQTPDKTIDHSILRRLVDAGAHVDAEVIGSAGGWGLVIRYGRASQTLAATRGAPRTWRQFETLASYLKELGIVEYRVNTAEFALGTASGKPDDKRSATASERMKRAHQAAAAHNVWFSEQVQASIDDPRPSVDNEVAKMEFAAKRAALIKRAGAAKKDAH